MTASEAKARKLFFDSNVTTLDEMRKHLSSSDPTLKRYLAKFRDELEEEMAGKPLSLLVSSKAEETRSLHLGIYKERLSSIRESMALCVVGNKGWLTYLREEKDLMKLIEKHEGLEIMHKVAEKKALSDLKKKPVEVKRVSKPTWMPHEIKIKP